MESSNGYLVLYGLFDVKLPQEEMENLNELSSSDEEFLMNMDYEELENMASSVPVEMPDLKEAAIVELPPPETPVMPKPTETLDLSKQSPKVNNELTTDIDCKKRFKSSTDDEIEMLFAARQAPATKKNTAWGMKLFQDWNVEVFGSPLDMETVHLSDLADRLKRFYVEARPKNNGSSSAECVYHRNSMINIRGAINRQLANLHRNIDIVKDKEFKTANGVLDGLLKHRTRAGLSKPTQHKTIIEEKHLKKIATYLSRAPSSPIILRQHVWYNLAIHFVSRGMEFHHQLKTDSFEFHNDESGEYVTLKFETQQKNFQGGLNSDQTPSDKRLYSTDSPTCPVKMLRFMLSKTDPNATHLFNHFRKNAVDFPQTNDIWYTSKPLAKRTFANFLPEICKAACVDKLYTPHCLRATAIQSLNDEGFEARHIMYMSSHKNEASLRSYNRNISTSQKKAISASLSAITLGETHERTDTAVLREKCENTVAVSTSTNSVTFQNIMTTPGFFTNSTFSGCNFNFHSVS